MVKHLSMAILNFNLIVIISLKHSLAVIISLNNCLVVLISHNSSLVVLDAPVAHLEADVKLV